MFQIWGLKRTWGVMRSRFNVLLSCMHLHDFSIIARSNLQNVDTLIINQCETDKEEVIVAGRHKMIKTPSRGLSVSRNMAIQNCDAQICLIADDDEVFAEGLEEKVLEAYKLLPDADVIAFHVANHKKNMGGEVRRLRKYDLLRVSSVQISFKLSAIKNKIGFDIRLGAGTNNGCGEENKFLLDCYKNGLKIYYVPVEIAKLLQSDSTWFSGYDKKFFFNRGKTTRYILGLPIAFAYGLYYLTCKREIYKGEITRREAGRFLMKGLFINDMDVAYEQLTQRQ